MTSTSGINAPLIAADSDAIIALLHEGDLKYFSASRLFFDSPLVFHVCALVSRISENRIAVSSSWPL